MPARARGRVWLVLAGMIVALVAAGGLWLAVAASTDPLSGSGGSSGSSGSISSSGGLPVVAEADLPVQARQVIAAIDRGGPFRYRCCDDVVFRNDEGRLPAQRAGYYHEFTVTTPGSSDRGPRRIVTGSGGELYYTADHYRSFERIRR